MDHSDKLPKAVRRELHLFFETHSASKFSSGLRRVVFEYTRQNLRAGLHVEFGEFLGAVSDWLEMLDKVAKAKRKGKKKGRVSGAVEVREVA